MGKGALLLVFGASVVFTVMNLQLNKSAEQANQNLVAYFEQSVARGVANQAAEYLLEKLADSSTWRVTTAAMLDPDVIGIEGDYFVHYTIRDVLKSVRGWEKEVLELRITARYERETETVVVYMSRQFGFVPEMLRGVFTAAGRLDRTFGELTIDGRNHSRDGSLDPSEPGVFGVSSGKEFRNTGDSPIGGRGANGKEYAPKHPEDLRTIEEDFDWDESFPSSPDEVLGYPEGSLKSLAQTGIGGSQYVTNPSELRFPLRGITYVEPIAAWRAIDLSYSEGLLIVHNGGGNARLENANTKSGPFRGLIIADYMFHIHMDITGAVVLLSPRLEEFKECRGNEDNKVLFSIETVKDATELVLKNGSGWNGRVPIIGWKD